MAYMRQGLSAYQELPENWSWLYYPPPYAFADPLKLTPPSNFYASPESMGMGGCGCSGGCGCNGDCDGRGVGAVGPLQLDGWMLATLALAGIGLYQFSRKKR